MLKGLLKKIFEREIPEVVRTEDLIDPRAREIAEKNFIRITDIPDDSSGIEDLTRLLISSLDASRLQGNSLPEEYNQMLARAIMHYELTKRPNFKIRDYKTNPLNLGIIKVNVVYFRTIKREISVSSHESMANYYAKIAENIYSDYEKVNQK